MKANELRIGNLVQINDMLRNELFDTNDMPKQIYIQKVTPLHNIRNDKGKVIDEKVGMTYPVNEWHDRDGVNEHFSNLYKCDKVFIVWSDHECQVVLDNNIYKLVDGRQNNE